jgi:hypothetical protein
MGHVARIGPAEIEPPMVHYHFNFRSRWNVVHDKDGLDLRDLHAARETALASVREDFADARETGAVHPPYSIIITDASGRELATITSRDVFQS